MANSLLYVFVAVVVVCENMQNGNNEWIKFTTPLKKNFKIFLAIFFFFEITECYHKKICKS